MQIPHRIFTSLSRAYLHQLALQLMTIHTLSGLRKARMHMDTDSRIQ